MTQTISSCPWVFSRHAGFGLPAVVISVKDERVLLPQPNS